MDLRTLVCTAAKEQVDGGRSFSDGTRTAAGALDLDSTLRLGWLERRLLLSLGQLLSPTVVRVAVTERLLLTKSAGRSPLSAFLLGCAAQVSPLFCWFVLFR